MKMLIPGGLYFLRVWHPKNMQKLSSRFLVQVQSVFQWVFPFIDGLLACLSVNWISSWKWALSFEFPFLRSKARVVALGRL